MRKGLALVIGVAGMIGATGAGAAALVEQGDSESTTLMYIEGTKMRSETHQQGGYAIADYRAKTLYMIDPVRKQVLDMSAITWPEGGAAQKVDTSGVKASLDKVGKGPTIAGYDTEHYVLKANGRKCEDLYVSRAAARDAGFEVLIAEESSKELMAANAMNGDECDLAEYKLIDSAEFGWPLRTVDAQGTVTEVIRIETNAKLPPGGFELPAGFEIVDYGQLIGSSSMNAPEPEYQDIPDEVYDDEDEMYDEEYGADDYEDSEEYPEDTAEEDLGDTLRGFFERFNEDDQ